MAALRSATIVRWRSLQWHGRRGEALRVATWSLMGSLVALSLTGCMVGPDFQPPPPPDVKGYTPEQRLAPAVSTALFGGSEQDFVMGLDVGGQWWRAFESPQINAFVEEAVRNQPTLRAAQFALRSAQERVLAAQGSLWPQASGDLSFSREQTPAAAGGITGPPSLYNLYNASVNVTYTLDVFGGIRRQIEAEQAGADAKRFELEATYLALTANVVTAAFNDAALRAQIAATQEIIKAEEDQLRRVERQFEVGAVSQSVVLSQRATLAQTQAQLPPLQKQLAQGRNLLMAYLGRLPSEDGGESLKIGELKLPKRLPVSLPSTLVRQRPDIMQAEQVLHQSAALVGVNVANLLPQITLTPSIGTEALKTAQLFSPQSFAWTVAASLQQKLFDSGQLYYTKESAVANFERDYALYQSTVVTAFQNVADSLRAIQYDSYTLNAQSAAEKAALDSLKMAEEQFKVGAVDYSLIITAQQNYQSAVISRIQAQARRFSDTVALFQALGGGWWNRDDLTRNALPRNGSYFEGPDGPGVAATKNYTPNRLVNPKPSSGASVEIGK